MRRGTTYPLIFILWRRPLCEPAMGPARAAPHPPCPAVNANGLSRGPPVVITSHRTLLPSEVRSQFSPSGDSSTRFPSFPVIEIDSRQDQRGARGGGRRESSFGGGSSLPYAGIRWVVVYRTESERASERERSTCKGESREELGRGGQEEKGLSLPTKAGARRLLSMAGRADGEEESKVISLARSQRGNRRRRGLPSTTEGAFSNGGKAANGEQAECPHETTAA